MENEPKLIEIAFNPIPGGFVVDVYDGLIGNHVRHVADLTDKAIQKGLETLGWMHWLPMTDDAVFEDGEMYLMKTVNRTELGYFLYTVCARDESCGSFRLQANLKHPIIFTHYARITEPK